MERTVTIQKTDLARRARQVVDRARRGEVVIVESFGEEQVAVMDALDYRILQAVVAYYCLPPHPAPALEMAGLGEEELDQAVRKAGGLPQARWDRVLEAYLDGHISLARAATLLNISPLELGERFRRLEVPRRQGPETLEEARSDTETARAWVRR
jgi:prevent-host-death family protein